MESIAVLFIVALAMSAPNIAHAIGVNATISAGPYPVGVVYNSGLHAIVTANYKTSAQGSNSANSITFISDSLKKIIGQVNIPFNRTETVDGAWPTFLAYAADLNQTYVSCGSGVVTIVSDKDSKVVANVKVGRIPIGMAYDSGKKEVFVANSYDDTVSVIDANNKVIATISGWGCPDQV